MDSEKRLEVVRKGQMDPYLPKEAHQPERRQEEESHHGAIPCRTSPPLPPRVKKYALELWVEIESRPGVFMLAEEEMFSVDFAIDSINNVYPGCTGVHLSLGGHMLAFFRRKHSPKAGLNREQSVEACKILKQVQLWMGDPARVTSSLSAGTHPFIPLATSSGTAGTGAIPRACFPWDEVTQPLYSSGEESALTNASDGVSTTSQATSGKKQGKQGGRGHKKGVSDGEGSKSDTGSEPTISSQVGRRKKKDGVSTKIQLPEFGGKKGHPQDVANAFHRWAHTITYYREYYEDSYLMPLVIASLKDDVADVFDWSLHTSSDEVENQDLGVLLQKFREHYCGSLTFREQSNMVENLQQGTSEEAADFLIRVGSSVDSLMKDWKDDVTREEAETLQYEVSLNGVKAEIRHVLDSEIACHGQLTPTQMYDAVKKYETYMARNKHLEGKSPYTGQTRATAHPPPYKPRFQKTTAFKVAPGEIQDQEA